MHKPEPKPPYALGDKNYETRDVSLGPIIKWVFFLFVFMGFSSFVAWIAYRLFLPNTESLNAIPGGLPSVRRVPTDPKIQARPKLELNEFRRQEEARLNNYGWINKQTNTVRLPVNKAVDLIAERGFPVTEATVPPQRAPETTPNSPAPGATPMTAPPTDNTVTPNTSGTSGASGAVVPPSNGEATPAGAGTSPAPNGTPGGSGGSGMGQPH